MSLSKATGREATGRALSPVLDGHTMPPPIGAWGWSGVLLALEGSRVSYQKGSLISFVPTWLSPSKQQQCQERTEGKPRTGCRKVNSTMPRKQKLGEQQLRPHQQEGGLVP